MFTFRGVVLWIHVVTIILWVGGMVAVSLVVVPAVRRLAPDRGAELVVTLVRRFQMVSREMIFLIFLSGLFNVLSVGWLTDFAYAGGYLKIVGVKISLFVVMVANQIWYGTRLIPHDRDRLAFWSAAGNAALAAVVVYLGLTLR